MRWLLNPQTWPVDKALRLLCGSRIWEKLRILERHNDTKQTKGLRHVKEQTFCSGVNPMFREEHANEGRGTMSMIDSVPPRLVEPPEAELVRKIETIIRKIAAQRATPSDVQALQELQKRRLEMMRPRRRIPA